MSRRPPVLPPDDLALWDKVSETVKPLPSSRKNIALKEPTAARAKPVVRLREPLLPMGPPKQALDLSNDREIARGDRKRIKQGVLRPELSLDLHGFTVARAEKALVTFIKRAGRDDIEWIEIITGHGRFKNTEDGEKGVLKRLLPEWLNSPGLRPLIKRVIPAPHARGGAVWVRLVND